MKAAGVEMFNQYGAMNVVSTLADGDVTKYDAVFTTQYSVCLLELMIRKTKVAYENNYHDIIIKRSKQ